MLTYSKNLWEVTTPSVWVIDHLYSLRYVALSSIDIYAVFGSETSILGTDLNSKSKKMDLNSSLKLTTEKKVALFWSVSDLNAYKAPDSL